MQIQMIELQSWRILGIVSQILSQSYPAVYIYISQDCSQALWGHWSYWAGEFFKSVAAEIC